MNNRLTKQDLIDLGISVEFDSEGNPHVFRTYYRWGHTIRIEKALCKKWNNRTYGKGKNYYHIAIKINNKWYSLTLGRVVYAWVYGEVPAGMHVDHIDNNAFNNKVDNLQLLTPAENNAKKNLDALRGLGYVREEKEKTSEEEDVIFPKAH